MRVCLLTLFVLSASAADVTFTRDVYPILRANCSGCHQAGEIGPMPLTTYAEARPWAAAIRQAVATRTMPPWHADAATSHRIANARALTEAEVRTITTWADTGARQGPAMKVKALEAATAEGWRLGKPDLIVRVNGFKIPATGTVEYTFLVTPVELKEDMWIEAAEWRIDKRQSLHHMNAFIRPPGSSYIADAPLNTHYVASKNERGARRPDELETNRRELLIGYEPGYRPIGWGEGRGKLLRKGSDIVFEMHYNTSGRELVDNSELGIYFAKTPPRERVLSITPADSKFAIPPGDGNYRSEARAQFTEPVKLISMQPHMHLRGKDFRIDATYADGRHETLLNVPRYDFRWQTTYFLRDPLALPAGTTLEVVAHFDNSANNPANPDPKQTVRWGDQSWEEMNIGFLEVAFPATANAEVAKLSDTPKPAPGSTTSNR